jgi:hypothetical protein
MSSNRLTPLDGHARYTIEQLLELRRQMLRSLGQYCPALSGIAEGKSPPHCGGLQTERQADRPRSGDRRCDQSLNNTATLQ